MNIFEILKQAWYWVFGKDKIQDQLATKHINGVESKQLSFKTFLKQPIVEEVISTNCQPLWRIRIWNNQVFYSGDDKCIKSIGQIPHDCKVEIETVSGNSPDDFAITNSGKIIYVDWQESAVFYSQNGQVHPMINLSGWRPWTLCCSAAGDILVAMRCDDVKRARIVGYQGPKKTREYSLDRNGRPLYGSPTFIAENKNGDVCVSDADFNRVTVVDPKGNFKFHYNGQQVVRKYPTFYPKGITTDSQCNILVADQQNSCIHVLDRIGQLVSFITDLSLNEPYCLCVGKGDELYVGEYQEGNVKKIRYLQ